MGWPKQKGNGMMEGMKFDLTIDEMKRLDPALRVVEDIAVIMDTDAKEKGYTKNDVMYCTQHILMRTVGFSAIVPELKYERYTKKWEEYIFEITPNCKK